MQIYICELNDKRKKKHYEYILISMEIYRHPRVKLLMKKVRI